ncbi:MAG: hypothetical protein HS109_12470 [Burkholderiales bacterium]|nr:hypothetical protein [Burkholderiales bacterium]
MRTLIVAAVTIVLATPALACEVDKAANSPPDASIAASKDAAAPAPVAKDVKVSTTVAAPKPAKDQAVATSSPPQPVYFNQRAAK